MTRHLLALRTLWCRGLAACLILGALCFGILLAAQVPSAAASELFADPMFGVSTIPNIQYASHPVSVGGVGGNLALKLDLYQPTGPGLPAQLPAIVLMHGGYFAFGTKNDSDMEYFANEFAARGYVVASIDYRLLGNLPPPPGAPLVPYLDRVPASITSRLPGWGVDIYQYADEIAAAVYDQATAVNWLAANAATYGINIDTNNLMAGGYSAGAVSSLAMGAGIVDGMPDVNLRAVYSMAGALFGWESAIDSSMPATFLIHGTQDTTVPYSEEAPLQAALDAAGTTYDTLIIPGAGHSDSLFSNGVLANQQMLFDFMAGQLVPVPEPGSLTLGCMGAAALAGYRLRRRRMRKA